MTTFFEGKLSFLAHYAMLGENWEKLDAGKNETSPLSGPNCFDMNFLHL